MKMIPEKAKHKALQIYQAGYRPKAILFNESNKYLIPYESTRFLAPRCILYRQGAEIRSTLLKGSSDAKFPLKAV